MTIKNIFDEISNEGGSNMKMTILGKYVNNDFLKRILYLANSPRIKFYIKQIPEYEFIEDSMELQEAVNSLERIGERVYTGSAATDLLKTILSYSHPDNAYIIERIIEKDCKIGMGTSNINKVFPNLIEKTSYMGAIPFDAKKAKKIFEKGATGISEIKADGRYCNIIIRGGEVEMESRQGEPTVLGDCTLVDELSTLEDCVLNGELVMNSVSRLESNGIIASIIDIMSKLDTRTDSENNKKISTFEKKHGMTIEEAKNLIQIKVWDIISIDDYYNAISVVPRFERLIILKSVINSEFTTILLVEYKFVKTYEEAIAHFVEALERGEEGTVLKSLDGIWKNGKHPYQIKMKVEFDLDLKIIGFNYGNKGTKNENVISSVTCESSCGKLTARAQGIAEDKMVFITENQDTLLGTIAKVKCNGLSSNSSGGNSLFYPVLKELRDDKIEADTFEQCVEIDLASKGLKAEINE